MTAPGYIRSRFLTLIIAQNPRGIVLDQVFKIFCCPCSRALKRLETDVLPVSLLISSGKRNPFLPDSVHGRTSSCCPGPPYMAGSKSSLLPGLSHIWGLRFVYGNCCHILTSKCGRMLRSSFVLPSFILRSSFLHLPEALFGATYHPIYAGCCLRWLPAVFSFRVMPGRAFAKRKSW